MDTGKKGFTIIEVLVIIVIIGALAAMTIGGFGGMFERNKFTQYTNETRSFFQRINNYTTTSGKRHVMEIDRNANRLRFMKESATSNVIDSISYPSGYGVKHSGSSNSIVLTIRPDGSVQDNDDIRKFKIYSDVGDTVEIYISPLGILEVQR